ncbi:MAG: hypothetical protein NZ853_05990 [Leptospiraceae bacterium]|nr:hypothetical protein [Leptospiraceae bacterium]
MFFVFLVYAALVFLFHIRSFWEVKDWQYLDKPIVYSTHYYFLDLQPENCFDKNLKTSCKELCNFREVSFVEHQTLKIDVQECAFVWQISPTHQMDCHPPKRNLLKTFGLFLSQEDLKNQIPKRIRLELYTQKLYQINHEYRFPDQPVLESFLVLDVSKKEGWQFWNISSFNQSLRESKGFSENIYQRWLKIQIEEVHHPERSTLTITEFFYQDEFFQKELPFRSFN